MDTAHTETFTVTVTDGQLNIDFAPLTNRRAIVSAVEVVTAGGGAPLFVDVTSQVGIVQAHDIDQSLYETRAGRGFFTQDSKTVELGLGQAAQVDNLTIKWPSGIVQVLTNVTANQVLDLVEPVP